MGYKDYSHLGRHIGRAVRRAIRSGNFEDVGRTIGDGVQEITDDVNEVIGGFQSRRSPHRSAQAGPQGTVGEEQYAPQGEGYRNPASSGSPTHITFRHSMPGGASGLACAIVGFIVGVSLLIADIAVAAAGAFRAVTAAAFAITGAILFPLTAAAFCLGAYGIFKRRRARRFARYRDALDGASFGKISEIAEAAGENEERTRKDLRKMITSGACPHGHLDVGGTCFMVDDDTYEEYLEAERSYNAREKAAHEEEGKKQAGPQSAELENVRQEGLEYLRQIRAANDALSGKEISDKLDRLENVSARIFQCVEQHPEKLPEIRRFMRYYMPTTLKLVKSYQEFAAQPVEGENITAAKKEIENALDTISTAFENLLDSLFADDALDVSTDISTLETMLKQEGLTGSDFQKAAKP